MLNILNVAQTGLKTSQIQVENVMNNLANETTEGYKKRVVNISELEQIDARMTGRGVQVDDVSRITDIYMYQNLVREESKLSNLNELTDMLSEIESIFTETDTSGMSADINRYFNSIENLRTSPQNEIYKNDVENNAKVIVANLQTLYSNIEQKEASTIENIEENIGEINNILTEIGNISQQIVENSGTSNDLLDKRDSLEKELAQYIDVEISRGSNYQLEIAGVTAVRFDTNVQEIVLIEEYTPQSDVYAAVDSDGDTIFPREDSLIPTSWDDAAIPEEQTIDISGTVDATGTVNFLGTSITPGGTSATDVRDEILNTTIIAPNTTSTNEDIINNWNDNNPDREIESITIGTGDQILITYKDFEGDVPAIDNTDSSGIVYTGSIETTKGEVDSFTYTLNNEFSFTVTHGETIYEADGTTIADINEDGVVDASDVVNETNALQAMVYKINQSEDASNLVTAYHGAYEIADDGTKILTSDDKHSEYDVLNPKRYLVIESRTDGEKGSFVGEFLINDSNSKSQVEKNDYLSKEGMDDIHIEIFEEEITLTGGAIKAMVDNVNTDSGNNMFNEYKDKLDQFAKTLSNLTDSYIENADQSYIYGTDNVELSSDEDKKVSLNLFTGADVKSLTFNAESLNTMTQDKLDYLATIQWKEDIDFDGTGLNNQSFSQFYQTLRVNVADNKENVDFKVGAQSAVTESMQNAYDKMTKVDKDEEMIQLIKYQSAYEANAKMITIVDEMLQTLLGM